MDSIIFDVDGTLWDARAPIARSWNRAIGIVTGKEGNLTAEGLGKLFGRPMEEILRTIFPNATPEARDALGEACYREEERWLHREPGTLYPGVRETLAQLARRYPLYIVSNCQKGYIETLLEVKSLGEYFSGHLCYGDTGVGKGQTLLRLAAAYGLKSPVYVGDTQGDADACREAGMPMVYAAYGLGEVARPWKQIGAFPELPEVMAGIRADG